MGRPRSEAHVRALEAWKQGSRFQRFPTEIHSNSQGNSQAEDRKGPHRLARREWFYSEGNAIMASIYDEAISAIEKADVLVDQTGFSKSTISAWRTTTTALPAFAILSLLGHPIAGPIVMSRLGELAYVPPLTPEEQATREIKREAKRASIRLIEMLRAAIEENEK